MKELWYKNAVIYGLDVKTFQDLDGDGMGDFKGFMNRLPYLKSLGISGPASLRYIAPADQKNKKTQQCAFLFFVSSAG